MSPLTWWRNTDNLPAPQRIDVPTPTYPVVDRTVPTCPPQQPHQAPAPERVRGSAVGMARYPSQRLPMTAELRRFIAEDSWSERGEE